MRTVLRSGLFTATRVGGPATQGPSDPSKKKQGVDSYQYPPVFGVPPTDYNVKVPEPEKIAAISKSLFGKELTVEDCVALMAPPAGSQISVYANERAGTISLAVRHSVYDAQWTFHKDESGVLFTELNGWDNNQWAAPRGLGTRIFAKQVEGFERLGISRIDTVGVGPEGSPNPDACGHIAWPLMGFNMELPDDLRARLPDSLKSASCINELLLMDGGIEWWKQNAPKGHLHMSYAVEPGSTSREITDARMAAKGWTAGDLKAS